MFDFTARKKAERALHEQQKLVVHLARAAMLGELSAAFAHELNQPLTAILCNAQAGQRFLAQTPPDLEELHAILADIVAEDHRAGALIARLRGLYKKEEYSRQVLDINALIEEVTQLLHSDLVTKQVSLQLQLAGDLPKTMGDHVQLRQVLLNLIMNATEAMTACWLGPRQLEVGTSLFDAGSLEIVVRDTGPGIATQMQKKIFEPFVTGKPSGLGMGLAISRTIVCAHGGQLWVDTTFTEGAALHFTLPVFPDSNS